MRALVIVENNTYNTELSVQIRLSVEYLFPMDIIVRRIADINKRIKMGDCFLQEIMSKGRSLYEAKHKSNRRTQLP